MTNDKFTYLSDFGEATKFSMRYFDSLFFTRMELVTDGRHRGLWVFIQDEFNARHSADDHWFKEGMKKLKEFLQTYKEDPNDPNRLDFELRHMFFPLFFQHRAEPHGVRMTWAQARKFHAAFGEALEKEKKEEDFPERPEDEG